MRSWVLRTRSRSRAAFSAEFEVIRVEREDRTRIEIRTTGTAIRQIFKSLFSRREAIRGGVFFGVGVAICWR